MRMVGGRCVGVPMPALFEASGHGGSTHSSRFTTSDGRRLQRPGKELRSRNYSLRITVDRSKTRNAVANPLAIRTKAIRTKLFVRTIFEDSSGRNQKRRAWSTEFPVHRSRFGGLPFIKPVSVLSQFQLFSAQPLRPLPLCGELFADMIHR